MTERLSPWVQGLLIVALLAALQGCGGVGGPRRGERGDRQGPDLDGHPENSGSRQVKDGSSRTDYEGFFPAWIRPDGRIVVHGGTIHTIVVVEGKALRVRKARPKHSFVQEAGAGRPRRPGGDGSGPPSMVLPECLIRDVDLSGECLKLLEVFEDSPLAPSGDGSFLGTGTGGPFPAAISSDGRIVVHVAIEDGVAVVEGRVLHARKARFFMSDP